jgi:hypothetical protein
LRRDTELQRLRGWMAGKGVAPDGTSLALLKLEAGWMMQYQWPITTVQFYQGDAAAAAAFLRERLGLVAKLNPWLGGRLVKKGGGICGGAKVELQFSKENVPIDEMFGESSDVQIHPEMPYSKLAEELAKSKGCVVENGNGLIASGRPVCKLTVLSSAQASDSFAVIFSMSHTVGDGHTYYTVLDMLSETAELTAMEVTRHEKFQDAIPDTMGKKEYDFMMNPPFCMICHYMGIMVTAKKVTPQCFLLDKGKLDAAKAKAKAESGAAAFVSTNDILTSGFGRAVKAKMLTMAVNMRSKIAGLTAKHAGNYFGGLVWGPEGYGSPNAIRSALSAPPPLSRATLPGCCVSGNWTAMISNWSSMSKGNLDIPSCQQTLHLPYLNTAEMMEDSCIVFKARPGEVAVMLFLQNATLDAVKAELPLGDPVSETMFAPAK